MPNSARPTLPDHVRDSPIVPPASTETEAALSTEGDVRQIQQDLDFGDERPVEDDAVDEVETALGWTRGDRLFIAVMCGVIIVLTCVRWYQLKGGNIQPVEFQSSDTYEFRVEINTATWVEWSQLEGIGPHTARAIVADREANGPFESIDDIQRVQGIGPKRLEAMRPFLLKPE